MASLVVGRDGRAGQNEPPGLIWVIVDVAPYLVPDARHQLPLVYQARSNAIEEQGGVQETGRSRCVVSVKANRAPGGPERRLGLAAAAGSLDEDCACRPQAHGKFLVGEPREIVGQSPEWSMPL